MVAWVVKKHADGLLWMENDLVILWACDLVSLWSPGGPGGQSCDVGPDLLLSGDEWQARCDCAGVICKTVCWTGRAGWSRINENNKKCSPERGTLNWGTPAIGEPGSEIILLMFQFSECNRWRHLLVIFCPLPGDSTVGKSAISQMFHSDGSHFPKSYSMVRPLLLLRKDPKHISLLITFSQ